MATTTAPKKANSTTRVLTSEMRPGDVLSEVSHYTYNGPVGRDFSLKHHESGKNVVLDKEYIENLLCSANQFHGSIVEVGKEDKYWTESRIADAEKKGEISKDPKLQPKPGDVMTPGIRTIWENIHSPQVLSVCFQKQDEPLKKKELQDLRDAQIKGALDAIAKAQKGKTGVAAAAEAELRKIQENPILDFKEGEMRILIGYKVQFTSRDGKYQCMDMHKGELRPVNINTIEWLVFNGVKYIVK